MITQEATGEGDDAIALLRNGQRTWTSGSGDIPEEWQANEVTVNLGVMGPLPEAIDPFQGPTEMISVSRIEHLALACNKPTKIDPGVLG